MLHMISVEGVEVGGIVRMMGSLMMMREEEDRWADLVGGDSVALMGL